MPQRQRSTAGAQGEITDELLRVALYAGEFRLSQSKIAERLGNTSQSTVSRLLQEAEKRGLLVRETRFDPGKLDPERVEHVRAEITRNGDLTEWLNNLQRSHEREVFQRAFVVPVRYLPSADEGYYAADIDKFAAGAAYTLIQLLHAANLIGVTWGSTVAHCVEAIRHLKPRAAQYAHPIGSSNKKSATVARQILPLAGELSVSGARADYGSTSVAHRLFQTLVSTPNAVPPPTLTGLLAFLPITLADLKDLRNADEVWKNLHPEGYEVVFGERGAVHGLDCILTSISPKNRPYGERIRQLVLASGEPQSSIQRSFIGDIGGVLLPTHGDSEGEISRIEQLRVKIEKKRTGLNKEQLKAVATRAREERGIPGVIVVAAGEAKAEVLVEAIKEGLVTNAIVDEPLAEAVLHILKPQAYR